MEQHQRSGIGQPLCYRTWRGRRRRVRRHGASTPFHAAVFFPAPRRSLFLIGVSPYYARLSKRPFRTPKFALLHREKSQPARTQTPFFYSRSTAIATEFPPPRHTAATPFFASLRIIS